MKRGIPVEGDVIRWARIRSGIPYDELRKRHKQLPEWESGTKSPTYKQLDKFAKSVYVSFGDLFLDEPPEESIPIPDFRTITGQTPNTPSPNLLDTIYICQLRQDWYREYTIRSGESSLGFVGTASLESDPEDVATDITDRLKFSTPELDERMVINTARSHFVRQIEDIGVLVMISGTVKNNTRRRLKTDEFRGFALADDFAPLIFINGTDAKVAQMFTLSHELAHIWLGDTALSNFDVASSDKISKQEEVWCNEVAANFLVPLERLTKNLHGDEEPTHQVERLAKIFRVSRLVILIRMRDAQVIDQETFSTCWELEKNREGTTQQVEGRGGHFYRTLKIRVGTRFAKALVQNTLEGGTLYRDAMRLLDLKKSGTFEKFIDEINIACLFTD